MLPERVAVVGCGGFIGSHLVERLLNLGVEVDGWDLEVHRLVHLFSHPKFHFQQSDYSKPDALQAIAKHQVVIHLAAICTPGLYNTEDQRVIHSNFTHPAQLADACAQNDAFLLYLSTSEVYGRTVAAVAKESGKFQSDVVNGGELLQEDSSPLVLGPISARRWSYACAKQLTERYLVALQSGRNLRYTVVRPFNFLGPAMDFIPGVDGEGLPRVMACFMDALLHKRPLALVDGGARLRAFTWIGDAIDALIRILEVPEKAVGLCFNIGNPANEIDIRSFAHLMIDLYQEITNEPAIVEPLQNVLASEFYGEGYEDSDRRLPDISKAQRLLGWNPQKGLEDTVRDTMRWYISHYGGQK